MDKRNLEQLEKVMNNDKVGIELELLAKSMKALELASELMNETEQQEIFDHYASSLYDLLMTVIDDEELTDMEENEMLNIIE